MILLDVKLPIKRAWRDENTSPDNIFSVEDDYLTISILKDIDESQQSGTPKTRQDFDASNMGQLAILYSNQLIYIDENKILLTSKGMHQLAYIDTNKIKNIYQDEIDNALDDIDDYDVSIIDTLCNDLAILGIERIYIKELISEIEKFYGNILNTTPEDGIEDFLDTHKPPPDSLGDILTMALVMDRLIKTSRVTNIRYSNSSSAGILSTYIDTVRYNSNDGALDDLKEDLSTIEYVVHEE